MLAVGAAAVGVYAMAFGVALGRTTYDVWGTFLTLPVIVALGLALAFRLGRVERDPWLTRVIVAAFGAKLASTLVRYYVTFYVYRTADARGYDNAGHDIADALRQGHLDLDEAFRSGTHFIDFLTGVVYAVAGPSLGAGYLVFAFLSFVGVVFSYRAFRYAVPEGDHRRFAYLLLFLPTLLYWPSSIGKDAVMVLGIGLALYGAALLLGRRLRGVGWFAAGVALCVAVRPHIAIFLVGSTAIAALISRRTQRTTMSLVVRLVSCGVLVAAGLVLASRLKDLLDIDSLSLASISEALQDTEDQTSQGGSSFDPATLRSPADLPWSTMTVLFRPLPTEANSPQILLTSLEGVALAALIALSYPRLLWALGRLRDNPFVTLCLIYVGLFVVGFSSFGNFGILARQRSQLWPVALVFVALPARRRVRSTASSVVWEAKRVDRTTPAAPTPGLVQWR